LCRRSKAERYQVGDASAGAFQVRLTRGGNLD
jgi:hypothetical protein